MGGSTDPTKAEVMHDAERASCAIDFQPEWNDAVNLGTAKEEDETNANIPTHCLLCSGALGHASEKCGQPVEVQVEHGKIRFEHCIVCEDTSLLLAEATGAQRNLVARDRDSWLMTTGKFTEFQGKLNRTPTVMELLAEVTTNLVAAARGQVKEAQPSMESVATSQGDGKELASAASKRNAEHPSSSMDETKTFRLHGSEIQKIDALLLQDASQKKWR